MLSDHPWMREDPTADDATEIREIHALTPPQPPSLRGRRRESWELRSTSNLSVGSEVEIFPSMSREFNAMVVAGSTVESESTNNNSDNLGRIGEEEMLEETNPLAIVADSNPIPSPRRGTTAAGPSTSTDVSSTSGTEEVSVHRVKKEEVESKIAAWQTAEIAKINNRFKRQDVVINGWESEQVEKATTWLKKVERKLEEQRARAMEKMQNDAAKARRKAEEKRASAESKRGTKVARVLELSNLLRAVGRAPSKRSFF